MRRQNTVMVLQGRKEELQELKEELSEKVAILPEGKIRVERYRDSYRCFRLFEGDRKGTYIKKDDEKMAYELATREYYQRMLDAAEKEMRVVEKTLRNYPKTLPEDVYEELHPNRQELVNSYWQTDEEYVKTWKSQSFRANSYHREDCIYRTIQGERVRTKSELFIANALYRCGIPYFYEKPLQLNQDLVVHPDFTVLNVKTRKEYYWEHCGDRGPKDNLELLAMRQGEYENAGLFLGEDVIFTLEAERVPYLQERINRILTHYFPLQERKIQESK